MPTQKYPKKEISTCETVWSTRGDRKYSKTIKEIGKLREKVDLKIGKHSRDPGKFQENEMRLSYLLFLFYLTVKSIQLFYNFFQAANLFFLFFDQLTKIVDLRVQ